MTPAIHLNVKNAATQLPLEAAQTGSCADFTATRSGTLRSRQPVRLQTGETTAKVVEAEV